jgi:hypothetical protein
MSSNRIAKLYRLILAAFISASLLFHTAILWESQGQIAAGYGDFIIFYTGAQIINDGRVKELFKVETQNAYQAKFDVPQLEWPLPFNHAPYELFLFLPLAYFSFPVAHAIWSGVNAVLLIIILKWLLPYVDSRHNFFVGISLLAWFPTMEALRLGQDSILSTALLLAVFVALKRKRDGWAGFFLALGLYKPQLVLPMGGALLVARRWRSVAVFSATGIILVVVISLSMVGLEGAFDFVSILRSMGNYVFIINPRNMPNVRGLSYVLLHADNIGWLAGAATLVISVGVYAICLYAWRHEFDPGDPVFDLQFALVIVTTVLISYHLYAHDLFPASLSLILLFRYVSSGLPAHRGVSNVFFALLIILFLPGVPRFLIEFRSFGWGALPILLVYTIIAVEIFSRRRVLLAQ